MPLTSLEHGCWLPVGAEGWQVGTPGSTRHHTGPSYSCELCMAQSAAYRTDWACSSERTGSTALSASEGTDFALRMLTTIMWSLTVNISVNPHHLSVHGNDVANEGAVLYRHGMAIRYTVGEGLLWGAGDHCAGHAIRNQARLSNVIVPCCSISHRWFF